MLAFTLKAAAARLLAGWRINRQEVLAYCFCTGQGPGRAVRAMLNGGVSSPPPQRPILVNGDVGCHGGPVACQLKTRPYGRRSESRPVEGCGPLLVEWLP